MTRRAMVLGWFLLGALVALPGEAEGQLSIQLHLDWVWSDGAWYPYHAATPARVAWADRRAGLRIPRAYLPPPGMCRLWYPNRRARKQPRPRPCHQLLGRYHGPAVVIANALSAANGWRVRAVVTANQRGCGDGS